MREQTVEIIKAFISGEMEIHQFMNHFRESSDIGEYLEGIISHMEEKHIPPRRRIATGKGAAQNKPFAQRSEAELFIREYARTFCDLSDEWKENPPKVGDYLRKLSPQTSLDAFTIHDIVADIYYQVDPALVKTESYHEQYVFCLEILPNYLFGGAEAEEYIRQSILPKYPSSMKKGERKRLIREAIRKDFKRDCKGYPRWIHLSDWPMGTDGKPMIYMGQKRFERHSEYRFRDSGTGELHTVTQRWPT